MNLASLLAALDALRGKDAKQLKIFAKKQTNDKHKLPAEKRDPLDCTSLLAKFIVYLIGRINQKYLNFGIEILIISNLIRHSIDDQGPAFCLMKGKENTSESPKVQSYSSTRNIASFFLMSNYFLTELFPKYMERIKWYSIVRQDKQPVLRPVERPDAEPGAVHQTAEHLALQQRTARPAHRHKPRQLDEAQLLAVL